MKTDPLALAKNAKKSITCSFFDRLTVSDYSDDELKLALMPVFWMMYEIKFSYI